MYIMNEYENIKEWTAIHLIGEMERSISDGYRCRGYVILHFEYVPEEVWDEIKRRLLT